MGNEALRINGFTNTVTTNNHITTRGSDWYWAVCALMLTSFLVILGLSFRRAYARRIFYYILALSALVTGIAYFIMASNLGWTAIQVEFRRSSPKVAGNLRQIFYVRYIDWFITGPLVLAALLLTGGLPATTITATIFFLLLGVVTGLSGALVKTSYKWGFFAFSLFTFFGVAFLVLVAGRAYASKIGADITRNYTICAVYLISLWFLYPIAWGVSEGGNVIAPDSEAIFYGILDILTKPVFAALLLWVQRNLDFARVGLNIRPPGETEAEPGEKREVSGTDAGADTNPPGTTSTNPETV